MFEIQSLLSTRSVDIECLRAEGFKVLLSVLLCDHLFDHIIPGAHLYVPQAPDLAQGQAHVSALNMFNYVSACRQQALLRRQCWCWLYLSSAVAAADRRSRAVAACSCKRVVGTLFVTQVVAFNRLTVLL